MFLPHLNGRDGEPPGRRQLMPESVGRAFVLSRVLQLPPSSCCNNPAPNQGLQTTRMSHLTALEVTSPKIKLSAWLVPSQALGGNLFPHLFPAAESHPHLCLMAFSWGFPPVLTQTSASSVPSPCIPDPPCIHHCDSTGPSQIIQGSFSISRPSRLQIPL